MLVELGDRLRQLRQDKHLNQDQAAKLVGVEQSTISAYECDLRQPSYAVLVRLAEIYHVSTDYLLGRSDTRYVDVSGLTSAEAAIISELVAGMAQKNSRLEELQ